jgi:hypothetical protein
MSRNTLRATTSMNWMFVCPAKMDHGPMYDISTPFQLPFAHCISLWCLSTKPRITIEEPAGPQISFEDVGEFMIANLNLASSPYNKKRVGLTTLLF